MVYVWFVVIGVGMNGFVLDELENKRHQLLKDLLVLLALHQLVKQLIIYHSLLDLLSLEILQFGLDPLLFLNELLEVLSKVPELAHHNLDLVPDRDLAGRLGLFILDCSGWLYVGLGLIISVSIGLRFFCLSFVVIVFGGFQVEGRVVWLVVMWPLFKL